jgi:hypothetical protein
MEKIRINRKRFTEIAWGAIFENASVHAGALRSELFQKSVTLDDLRVQATYNTGSIGTGAIWALFAACLYFKPRTIAEVGTFIGKSTFAMACAMDMTHLDGGTIYTCDFSNKIDLDFATRTQIRQFQMQSSTNMFSSMAEENRKCDVLMLDGRLQNEDLQLLPSILGQDTVILLDDFEGTEKGVINAVHLMNALQKTHYLAYAPSNSLMQAHGLTEGCTLGMIIPNHLVEHTNQ